jgi:Arc/MetJ-type ribon-helix-helix transcriptional regulator
MHSGMLIGMSTQIAVRLSDHLLARIDKLVAAGRMASRADAARRALDLLATSIEEAEITGRVIEGYRDQPVGEPDDWGRLDRMLDWSAASAVSDLERQEREAGLEW